MIDRAGGALEIRVQRHEVVDDFLNEIHAEPGAPVVGNGEVSLQLRLCGEGGNNSDQHHHN